MVRPARKSPESVHRDLPEHRIARGTASFILFLDIRELSRSRCDLYSCTWSLLLNTIAAVKQVEPLRITLARTMRAPPQQLSAVIYQPCHPPSWSAIVSPGCFRRRKRWKKIESGRLASLTAGCVRAHSGRTGTVIVASGIHARSSVTGSRNWATVSVRMSSHSNDRPWTVTS